MTRKPSPVVEKWNQLRFGLAWESSVLAPALAALTVIYTPAAKNNLGISTAAIDNRGRVFVNAEWAKPLSDDEARFVILHECLHLVLRHHDRRGGRDPKRWNIAADLVINEAIPKLSSRLATKRPEKGVYRDRDAPWIPEGLPVEEVYEHLRANPDKSPEGSNEVGGGCGVIIVETDEYGNPLDNEANAQTAAELGLSPNEWRNIAQNVANAAKSASMTGGEALAPLLRIPPSRVQWSALLREMAAHAISRAGRDVVTWARRSRRSPARIILPGTRTNDVRLAIIIDSSGSMSNDELAACVAETQAAIDAAGIAAYLVVHDHEVRTKTWIHPGRGAGNVAKQVIGRGGTVFAGAYEAVEAEKLPFAAVVHFTDGWPGDPWPARPRNCGKAVCALTPDGRAATVPPGWRVVPISIPGRV